jgi:hypothetical protein
VTKKPTFTEQRAALADDLEAARDRFDAAVNRQRREDSEGSDLILDLVHPLRDFLGSIEHNLPTAPPVDERADRHAELTRELCDAIVERGVLLQPAAVFGGVGLVLIDPSVGDEIDAAQKAKSDATVALTAFDRDHGDDLAEERRAARTAAYQQAIDEGDLARAGDLLRERDEEDLRTEREKTADALTSGEYENWDADGQGDIRRTEVVPATSGAMTTADLAG